LTALTRIVKIPGRPAHIARFPAGIAHTSRVAVAHVLRAAVARIASVARIAAVARCGEALGDAALQLRVAVGRKQEFGRHSAGVVLRPASLGARVGIGVTGSKSRYRQNSQQGCPNGFYRPQCSLKHVPPPHPRAMLGG
jgi:hypothetical protein